MVEVLRVASHASDILSHLHQYYEKQQLCDLVITTPYGEDFPAHAVVLGASSPFLWRRLQEESGCTEAFRIYLDFPEANSSALKMLLQFMYTGTLHLTRTIAGPVKALAEKLQLVQVTDMCSAFLSGSYDQEDVKPGVNDTSCLPCEISMDDSRTDPKSGDASCGPKQFLCDHCFKSFSSSMSLKLHKTTKHSVLVTKTSNPFASMTLRERIRIVRSLGHKRKQKHGCANCGKNFSQQAVWRRHVSKCHQLLTQEQSSLMKDQLREQTDDLNLEHPGPSFRCIPCGYQTSEELKYSEHIESAEHTQTATDWDKIVVKVENADMETEITPEYTSSTADSTRRMMSSSQWDMRIRAKRKALSPKSRMKAYRERMKNNPDLDALNRQKHLSQQQLYREQRSEEQKQREREQARIRQQRRRQKLKEQGAGPKKKIITREGKEQMRKYWKEKKQESRKRNSAQKIRRYREKDREYRQEKRNLQKEKRNQISSESSTFTSNAKTKAASRASYANTKIS